LKEESVTILNFDLIKDSLDEQNYISVERDKTISFSTKICLEERESKYSQKGIILWMTSLFGAGKTTLTIHLKRALFNQDKLVYVLDGDKGVFLKLL
jgi:hypothetical protein